MINFPSHFKTAFFHHFGEHAPQRIPRVITELIGLPFLSIFSEVEEATPLEREYQLLDDVKEQLNLRDPIVLVESPRRTEIGYADGHLIVYPGFFDLPENQQRFCVTHELVHHQLRHPQKRLCLELAIAIADLAALYLFIPGLLLVELGAFFLENAVSRQWEKEADLGAIKALKTNVGALNYFRSLKGPCPYSHPPLAERIEYVQIF